MSSQCMGLAALPPVAISFACLWSAMVPMNAQELTFKSGAGPTSLIELYSSEGCSSCPPAEAWLNQLKDAPGLWRDTFPLAFHVDYWDGLGWPDRFARGDYTERQRHYAGLLRQDSVYTPEFIVNGQEWRRGLLGGGIPAARADKAGQLTLSTSGKKVSASYETKAQEDKLTLNVAWLGFHLVTDVERGENGGSRLTHEFVVLDWKQAELQPGPDGRRQSGPLEMKPGAPAEPGAVVAWVSRDDGAIVQVTGGWLAK